MGFIHDWKLMIYVTFFTEVFERTFFPNEWWNHDFHISNNIRMMSTTRTGRILAELLGCWAVSNNGSCFQLKPYCLPFILFLAVTIDSWKTTTCETRLKVSLCFFLLLLLFWVVPYLGVSDRQSGFWLTWFLNDFMAICQCL